MGPGARLVCPCPPAAAAIAILAPDTATPGLWSRVVRDTLDVGLLVAALGGDRTRKGRVAGALGTLLTVGAADLPSARCLSEG